MASTRSQRALSIAQLTLFVGAQFTNALQQHEYHKPTNTNRTSRRDGRRELLGILGDDALREFRLAPTHEQNIIDVTRPASSMSSSLAVYVGAHIAAD
ncbi:hypothetical protein B0T10DRAFT_555591 [Thelonectria olida]|uniref:Uncharacterized protein n=1 Tax=Thelonectria olida TaxID=1576542 RepID=A0A9P8WJ19_9HYPO|nr:hypothetical protein B0T10DRAFT_555591 [Thelonectria olida]